MIVLGWLAHKWWSDRTEAAKLSEHTRKRYDSMRLATYHAPYPNGWYKLCDSKQLPRGSVKEIKAMDLTLAVFRHDTPEGKVSVVDAHCPHLGANLVHGGKVKGNCLECPFHKWHINGEGCVTYIPYSDKIPSNAKTRSYPSFDYLNMVVFYFHADGLEPDHLPTPVAEIDDGRFVYRGAWDAPNIHMHIQEFAENSADLQHFGPLHSQMKLPWTEIPIPGLAIKHTADWIQEKDPDKKHLTVFMDTASLRWMGRDIPNTEAKARATFVGPASVIQFRFFLPEVGEMVLLQTHLPLEGALQQTQFRWYADPKIPRLLAWYVVGNWISQWRNDVLVWENKIFRPKPALASGDGPIPALRRWYKQFYSEGSLKYRHRQDGLSW